MTFCWVDLCISSALLYSLFNSVPSSSVFEGLIIILKSFLSYNSPPLPSFKGLDSSLFRRPQTSCCHFPVKIIEGLCDFYRFGSNKCFLTVSLTVSRRKTFVTTIFCYFVMILLRLLFIETKILSISWMIKSCFICKNSKVPES